jgi:hypothetical protein
MNLQEFYTSVKLKSDPEVLDPKYLDELHYFGEGISSRTIHYLQVFQRNQSGSNWFTSWNWVAFLLPAFWMLYRRLYAAYILFMGITILLLYIPGMIWEELVLSIVISILMGVFGDSIYIYFVRKAHQRNDTMNPGQIPLVVLICLHLFISYGVYYIGQLATDTAETYKANHL